MLIFDRVRALRLMGECSKKLGWAVSALADDLTEEQFLEALEDADAAALAISEAVEMMRRYVNSREPGTARLPPSSRQSA